MEFKKVPKKGRPQSTASSPSHPRPSQTNTQQPSTEHRTPVMSGRSLKRPLIHTSKSTNPLQVFFSSKKSVLLIVIAAVIVIGVLVNRSADRQKLTQNESPSANQKSDAKNDQTLRDNKATAPTYDTITPGGKKIEELGGWQRVSPATAAPVFAYTDAISNIAINVSQQPLPETFKNDTDDKVAELAKKFNATTTFSADQTKVYIGTSAKGPQSVIFTTDTLLILIKSEKNIDTKAWIDYINSLT